MFYGYIESEALLDPTVLNGFKPIKVDIEHVPTSKNHPFVHAYYLKIKDSDVEKIASLFSQQTKEEWYLLFWNDETVFAIFSNKVFQFPSETLWNSEKYKAIQQYGGQHGIGIEYMDFNKNFKRFAQVLAKK